MVLIQLQLQRGQRAEQHLLLDQDIQGLMKVLCMPQRMTGGAVVAGQQALAKQETAVIGIQQFAAVADQTQELLRAQPRVAGQDVFVEQAGAAQ